MQNRDRNKAILIVTLLIFSLIVIIVKGKVSTELSVFLPQATSKPEKLLHHQLDKGASSNLIFISLSGLPSKQLAELNQKMAEQLRQSGVFSKVTNSVDNYGLDDLAVLERYRYLLSRNDLDQQFSVEGLNQSLNDRLEGLASSVSPLEKRFIRQDPTAEVIELLDEWQGKLSKHKTPEQKHGVWFSENHERTLILAEIKADISDLKNQTDAVMEVRSIYDEIRTQDSIMIMTGPAAFAVESGEDIRKDVRILTLLAVFLVVIFLSAVYYSVITVFLIISPLTVGVITATACILLVNDQIHGITLAFGITLAGVAVDYPIHLLTGVSHDPDTTRSHIIKIWRTLRLGVLSTVIAYAAFLVSGFGGLQQLGLFTIIGLSTAALFSRWVLPFLAVRPRSPDQGLNGFHNKLKALGQSAPRFRWIVLSAMVCALAFMAVTKQPILHLDVDSLSPISDKRRAEGKMLRDDLGFWFGGHMLIATGKDKEAVLQITEKIEPELNRLIDNEVIAGFDMAAHFLPSQLKQSVKQSQTADVGQIQQNLKAALEGLPFKEKVFEPFLDDLRSTADLEPLTPDMLVDTPVGKKLEPLLFDFEDEAGGVILLHGVNDPEEMERFASQSENVIYLHLKSAATDLVERSVDWVSLIMLGCILLIYCSLAWAFKSFRRPLKIMVPTFSAAIVVAAILVSINIPLSIFHLISLLLVVGLGLDYALFFNRLPENQNEWDTTFKSLWICGITTILVFGVLTFSQTPPLEAIGITVGFGALMSIIFAAMWATKPEQGPARP